MKISVVIIVKNESKHIKKCLEALFKQSYRDFEIIVIDNGSTDGTEGIINSLQDKRIRYFSESPKYGLGLLRTLGIKKANGDYIFFTDGDCVPAKHWLEEGVKVLDTGEYAGVNGKTYYESQEATTISDSNIRQLVLGDFMTCNTAYTRNVLEKVNYFDPLFKYGHEDRDLAFSVMQCGKIYFSEDMLVFHQKKKLSLKALFSRAKRAEDMVYFIKKHGRRTGIRGSILYPGRLRTILCPPLLILSARYSTFYDLVFGFFEYLSFIYERVIIWKAAIKHRIFVI